MLSRTAARELAFELIFEWIFRDESIEDILETAVEARQVENDPFARETACGVIEHLEEIDSTIANYLKGWTLKRVSKVALSVMRLSVYEILYTDIPASVSINEAVELAKKYGGEEDASYINGVLGGIVRGREATES